MKDDPVPKRYTVDIDVGGTMTDGLFSDGRTATPVKVDTTPHDLTVCFLDCFREGASQLGFSDLAEFFEQVEVIRWSSTVATNVLAERKGPKLGLLVSRSGKGSANCLYGDERSPVIGHLVQGEAIIEVSQPVAHDEIVGVVKQLLERGVRRICVSLRGAFNDPTDELVIKRLIEDQFPDHTLGSVPVLLGSDICRHPDDLTRTHYALTNAYVHGPLATSLFKAEEEVMFHYGYRKPLLIGHINGGVARVAKTKAIDTVESGPVFGVFGSAYYAEKYQLPYVVSLDVGGTTVKIGVILQGQPLLTRETEVLGIPLKLPMALPHSIPLGGGSVVRATESSHIQLGPESMGAYPGPACYDLGGSEATLTDAMVVLGRINPESFLGGARWLNAGRADEVIGEHVARPLGLTVEAAALRVFDTACREISQTIRNILEEHQLSPRDFTLFAFGGNGPLFSCRVAEELAIRQVYVFALGAVFSTFGSSISPVLHSYEHAFFEPVASLNVQRLAQVLTRMVDEGLRDMSAEGFSRDQVLLAIELEVSNGNGSLRTLRSSFTLADGKDGLEELQGLYSALASDPGAVRQGGLQVERLRLKTNCPVATFSPVVHETIQGDAAASLRGERVVYWNAAEPMITKVCDQGALGAGATISAPAVIEGSLTTYVVPPGWQLEVDRYLNGRMTQA